VKFRGKGQIPQLGSKFHGLLKTLGPNYHYQCSGHILTSLFVFLPFHLMHWIVVLMTGI